MLGNGTTVSEFALSTTTPTAGGVVIRSSLPSRPMSIGGTNNAVAGINLTDAELAQIFTTASGTVTFGDSSQTGNITFTTATPATTPGAATAVVQSTTGPGQIILDDTGSGTGLNGNSGTVTLTPGTGDTAAFSETFDTPNLGTGKTLTPAGSVSDGNGGSDYAATFVVNTTGAIVSAVTTITTASTSQALVVYGTPVTFTATVAAVSGSSAPSQGSVDFFDVNTGVDLGAGTFAGVTAGSNPPNDTWTLSTTPKTLNVTTADAIRASYSPGTGFGDSSGTVSQCVSILATSAQRGTV